VDITVHLYDRSQGTAAQAINPLQGEQAVLGRLTVFNAEFTRNSIGNAGTSLEVTGRTQANTNDVLSPRL